MVPGLTTPIRDANHEQPLGQIDDNQRPLAASNNNRATGFVKPTLDPHQQKAHHVDGAGGVAGATANANANANAAAAADKKRKKVKPSSLCLTPPSLIQGSAGQSYQRGLCIGEGGFARCFQVNDGNGELYAAKTLAKAALNSDKTRSKLLTEIKIHRAMDHPNIVKFIDCFEDEKNVYMLLEMCSNQSLADMINRRRHLTEPEARFFFVQIMGAAAYMHSRGVVHRDLKLGNVFLDRNMNLKVGDFGLAARMDNVYSRRFTVCGTPNYISPEVLKRPHGHGFPADIWALGVILYAMLVGRPPFQDREVEKIYQRIKQHEPCFPRAPSSSQKAAWDLVPDDARDLIARMLHPNPMERPSVQQCLEHPWVSKGMWVSSIPASALSEPVYLFASATESAQNHAKVLRECGLDKIFQRNASASTLSSSSSAGAGVETVSEAEMRHTSNRHVLPYSISPPSTKDKYKPVAVTAEESPANAKVGTERVPDYDSPVVGRLNGRPNNAEHNDSPVVSRQRYESISENPVSEGQRRDGGAPPSSGGAPTSSAASSSAAPESSAGRHLFRNRFRFPLLAARTSTEADNDQQRITSGAAASRGGRADGVASDADGRSYLPPLNYGPLSHDGPLGSSVGSSVARPASQGPPRLLQRPSSTITINVQGTLRASLRQTQKSIRSALESARHEKADSLPSFTEPVEPPSVVTRWADFWENWGVAYCLSDGSVGMLYRDHTSMRMDPMFNNYVYFEHRSKKGLTTMHRTAADTDNPRRAKKIEVLNYVRRYMDRELLHAIEPIRRGGDVSQGEVLHHLQKYEDFIMFVMTDGSLQFNFTDHNKVIIYENGTKLGLITSHHQLFSWEIEDAITATRAKHFHRVDLTQKLVSIHKTVREYSQMIE